MVALQSAKEFWVPSNEWNMHGYDALREHLPFLWDNYTNKKRVIVK